MSTFKEEVEKILRILPEVDEREHVVPAIRALIENYGEAQAFKYALSTPVQEFLISLFVKAGLRNFDHNWLVERLDHENENRRFDAAVALAIMEDERGLKQLEALAQGHGPWTSDNVPRVDILTELHYLPVEYALRLKRLF